MRNRFIGDKAFYRHVLGIAVPIMIQNGITHFVSLLDNIMVGQVGTAQMSGVSIVNGLLFVFNLCVFGACSGAGIFTAQFYGSKDHIGIRHTFRFKLLVAVLLSALGTGIFLLGGRSLIQLYLTGKGNTAEAASTLEFGLSYLKIMLLGLLPFALSNAYASTLRETGQTMVPMVAGVVAVIVNLVLNFILIFGHFGAPALGVQGAAIATVISRYVELVIIAIWTHMHSQSHPFIQGVFRSVFIPGHLLRSIILQGMPLLVNEFLWSCGIAVMNQCYSTCGLDVVPSMNISSTIYNLSSVIYWAMGNAVGIIMGQMLGADSTETQIRDTNRKLFVLSVSAGVVCGMLMAAVSGLFPMLYNTTDSVRRLATQLICVSAMMLPMNAYTHSAYFTLRSGGQTMITFLFDCIFMWVICVPLAFCLSRFTAMAILPLYILCQSTDILKSVVGWFLIHKGLWIRNLTR